MRQNDAPQNTRERLRVQTILSALIAGIGVVLLGFMISTEDEPGALPLLLTAVGVGWYILTRVRLRSLRA